MSTIKFEVIEGNSKDVILVVDLSDEQPFAYKHFSKELDSLSLAFREGEKNSFDISELVAAVQKVTGEGKGIFSQFVTENNTIVNSNIAIYNKQQESKFSFREDAKVLHTGKEFMQLYQALQNDLIFRIHTRNIKIGTAVPKYVLEYEQNLANDKEEAA
ncbi:hypothetical protein C21_04431 [Arenibacter sp. NBRC 103722]|uniref:hypothetical protein n=1 Tax=Arenibacter sp. NBRC 103722 TaxID=1113929 RepID=UPI000852E0CE|nr:hypothetical protein [Arenibacter sp. NBRC 103722]GBF22237.1 hypothetical protein C21_04431 [Arenibacter sp. NBRC 103722]